MEITLIIDKDSLKKVQALVSDKRFREALLKTLMAAGMDLEARIVENITERASNTGALAQSWKVEPRDYDEVVVFSNLQYAPFVEYGTRPHRAPIDPLRKWAHLKLNKSGKELERTAWAIWQKIARKGTEGKRYLRDALENFNLNSYVKELLKEWENAR